MKTRLICIILTMLLPATMYTPLNTFALSYPPAPLYHRLGKATTVMMPGSVIHMFHSGTDEIKNEIRADDILTVYRIGTVCDVKEIGKIKVISYVGETYMSGEVVEGEIKPNDIAKKGKISLLIILAGACNR